MSELERYQKDLEAIRHVIRVFENLYGQKPIKLNEMQSTIQAKIKELEEPPDPWEAVKSDIEVYKINGSYRIKRVANYCQHLQSEVERLGSELANRPVVWCLKTSSGSLHTGGVNNTTILFYSMTDALSYAAKHGYNWLKADTYTGKESE